MEFITIAIFLGLIPAAIARSKGRSFVVWWIFGALLLIVALPASLLIKTNTDAVERRALAGGNLIKCPHCAELIKREARVCRFCGRDVQPIPTNSRERVQQDLPRLSNESEADYQARLKRLS
jgi:hypothetical protein